jgi:hypothetical protein
MDLYIHLLKDNFTFFVTYQTLILSVCITLVIDSFTSSLQETQFPLRNYENKNNYYEAPLSLYMSQFGLCRLEFYFQLNQ